MLTIDEGHKEIYLRELCELIRIPSRSTPEGGEEGPLQLLIGRQGGAEVVAGQTRDVVGCRRARNQALTP